MGASASGVATALRTHGSRIAPQSGLCASTGALARRLYIHANSVDFKVDADDLTAALVELAAGALAEFGKAHVRELAQFKARSDQHGVNVYTALPFELKKHVDQAGIAGSAAKNPASITKDGSGKHLQQARRLFGGGCLHLESPGERLP